MKKIKKLGIVGASFLISNVDEGCSGPKRKEIKETYKSIANEIEKAIKEIKKDFNLIAKHA